MIRHRKTTAVFSDIGSRELFYYVQKMISLAVKIY